MDEPSSEPQTDAEPGRRYLTLLFADLSQSTELVELMEAEQYAATLAALRNIYQVSIPRHGGVVVRVMGDGLLAMFGYPNTRETDGRDAVSAALELHQRVRELRLPLPQGRRLALHSGVHAGLVLVKRGDVDLGRYELFGPVPHVASRLSDRAAADQILVSEETLGPASRFFVTGPPQWMQLKGRAAPLLVYRVDALAELADRLGPLGRHASSVFVGRQGELHRLGQAMDQAIARRMRCVAVAGAPGMGKTRLIEHFLSQVVQRGCRVLRGYCDSSLGAVPLQPFAHMLQALAGTAAPHSAEAFAALFLQLAEEQPLLLFVDDWQWADDASHLVLALLRAQPDHTLLVVTSTRATAAAGVPAAADETIDLPPLTDAETHAAIAYHLPGADPFVVAEITRQADGNPLYIEELCHSAARGEVAHLAGKLAAGAGWLTRLVESRVQRLTPPQIELLRVAAVIGNVVPAALLQRLTGQATDGTQMLALAQQDFLFPGERAGTLRFKHGLTRDIIYDAVGLATRQGLHLNIARALRSDIGHSMRAGAGDGVVDGAQDSAVDGAWEALAYHYGAGGDDEQAAPCAEFAGDRALAASALDRARTFYKAALAALDRLPMAPGIGQRWVAVAQRLARIYVFDPVRSELAVHERALQLAQTYCDAPTLARSRYWLSYVHYGLGDARKAIHHGEQALQDARSLGDERLAVQVQAALGEAHCTAANYQRALPLLDAVIAVKRAHRSKTHHNVGLAFSLVCRAYLLGDQGQFKLAYECFDEAASCVAEGTHEIGATVQGWRSAVLLWQGQWQQAQQAARASARIAQATRSLAQLSIARAIEAQAAWMLQPSLAHLQTIEDSTAWLLPRASGLYRSLNHGWLCQGWARHGKPDAARRHAAQALLRARQRDLLGAAMSYRALALQTATAAPQAAARYLRLAGQVAAIRGSAHEHAATELCAAEVALLQGRPALAQAPLDAASAGFAALQMPWHAAQAEDLRRALR